MAAVEETKYFGHFGPFGNPASLPLTTDSAARKTFSSVPVIDLSALYSKDLSERHALAREVAAACLDVGFFYAAMHGVEQKVVKEAFEAIQGFFNLPEEEKVVVHYHNSENFRGYEPIFVTRHEVWGQGDLKEAFSFADHANQWPSKPAHFEEPLMAYYNSLNGFAQSLLGLFSLALDLPENFFETTYSTSGAGIRTLHYPPQRPQDVMEEVGIGAHTDYSWFTLVCQESVGGLEVQNPQGVWIPIAPKPDTFVVNIGDSLQLISNGRFHSTRHRVVNRTGKERYSMAFFKNPNEDAVLKVAPNCQVPGKKNYEDINVKEYVRMRKYGSRLQHPLVGGVVVDGNNIPS